MTCKRRAGVYIITLTCRSAITFQGPPVMQQPSAEAAALQLSAVQLRALRTGSHTFIITSCGMKRLLDTV